MTEAIVKEIELKTPYKVVDEALADSILRGQIVWEGKTILSEDRNDNPRDIEVGLFVQFAWQDRGGNPLMQPAAIAISDSAGLVPEAGQSIITAQQDAIIDVAEQIVSQMELHPF